MKLISDNNDKDKIGCGYYSKSRGLTCGISKTIDARNKLPFFYCFDCKMKIYRMERLDRANYHYNQAIKDILLILGTDLILEEKIKLVKALKKNGFKRDI